MAETTLPAFVETDRVLTLIGKNGRAHARLTRLSLKTFDVISSRGARPGTHLEVEFELPALGTFHTLHLPATVIERHAIGEDYHLTLKFDSLTTKAKQIIEDFMAYKQRLHQANVRLTGSTGMV